MGLLITTTVLSLATPSAESFVRASAAAVGALDWVPVPVIKIMCMIITRIGGKSFEMGELENLVLS